MPVGNDVVDLGHPLCQPDAIHPRFDSRAFTADEIACLGAATDAHRMRWSLWAAKESAFKAARKLAPQVRFIPRDFVVQKRTERAGGQAVVSHHLGQFNIWFDQTDDWLHAVASRSGVKPGLRVDGPPSCGETGTATDSSARVRKLARLALGHHLRIAPSELQIVTVAGIPAARRRGLQERAEPRRDGRDEPLPVDLSLSHDGRFVACAWE